MVSQLALGAIWGYQRFLSPHKGFRCAHSVLHGGTGCSGFAKYAIRDHGVWLAIPYILQRFRDCKEASLTLRAACPAHSSAPNGEETPRQRRQRLRRNGEEVAPEGACTDRCGVGCCALPSFCAPGFANGQTAASSDTEATSGTNDNPNDADSACATADEACGACSCSRINVEGCDFGCGCLPCFD